MTAITDFDVTSLADFDAFINNTTLVSDVDNKLREIFKMTAYALHDRSGNIEASYNDNKYTVIPVSDYDELNTSVVIRFYIDDTCNAEPTLQLGSFEELPMLWADGRALKRNDIKKGDHITAYYRVVFDKAHWVIKRQPGALGIPSVKIDTVSSTSKWTAPTDLYSGTVLVLAKGGGGGRSSGQGCTETRVHVVDDEDDTNDIVARGGADGSGNHRGAGNSDIFLAYQGAAGDRAGTNPGGTGDLVIGKLDIEPTKDIDITIGTRGVSYVIPPSVPASLVAQDGSVTILYYV